MRNGKPVETIESKITNPEKLKVLKEAKRIIETKKIVLIKGL